MSNQPPRPASQSIDRSSIAANAVLLGLFVGFGTALRASETVVVQFSLGTALGIAVAVGFYLGLLRLSARVVGRPTASGPVHVGELAADGGDTEAASTGDGSRRL